MSLSGVSKMSYADCPLCNNNDRVTKISTLRFAQPAKPFEPVKPEKRAYASSHIFHRKVFNPQDGFDSNKFAAWKDNAYIFWDTFSWNESDEKSEYSRNCFFFSG